MNRLFILILNISFLGTVSCSETAAPPAKQSSGSSNGSAFSLNKPPVDATKLQVSEISVAKVRKGSLWLGSLSYAASGQADFVKFKACHNETSQCFSGSAAVNRVLMPPFPLGKVTVTAQACVDSGRSTTSSDCGDTNSGEFIQPNNIDLEKYELAAQRANKIEQIKGYGARIKAAILEFDKGIEACELDQEAYKKLMAKRQMAMAYVALGDALLSESLTGIINSSGSSSESPSFDPSQDQKQQSLGEDDAAKINNTDIEPAMTEMEKNAKDLEQFTEYTDITKNAFASAGVYKQDPVSGVQAFGGVIMDLFTAKDAVASKCFAEENANREIDVIKEQINVLKKDVLAIDLKLGTNSGGIE